MRRELPGAFDWADGLRQSAPASSPPWCFVPIDMWHKVIPRLGVDADPGYRTVLAIQLAALTAWRMTQGIYRIDPAVFPALLDTPTTGDIPVEMLLRLPEWCVYVETPGLNWLNDAPIHGTWIFLDYEPSGSKAIHFLQDSEDDGHPFTRALFIELGAGSVEDCLRASVNRMTKPHQLEQARAAAAAMDDLVAAHSQMLSLALYLCSSPDISGKHGQPGNPTPKRTRRDGWRMFPADGPRVWDVGVRMGAAIRAAYQSEQIGGTHEGPRPHIRRAHWHTIISGARKRADGSEIPAAERRRDLRWMPPIPVNLDDVDALPAVIRRV